MTPPRSIRPSATGLAAGVARRRKYRQSAGGGRSLGFEEFADLLLGRKGQPPRRKQIPLLGLARAGKGGYFDDFGFPVGNGWDEIDVPGVTDNTAYALEITGDSMLPVYREATPSLFHPAPRCARATGWW